jgi:hypothetical protein
MQNNTHHETTEIGSCISVAEKLKSVSHKAADVKSTCKEVEIDFKITRGWRNSTERYSERSVPTQEATALKSCPERYSSKTSAERHPRQYISTTTTKKKHHKIQ